MSLSGETQTKGEVCKKLNIELMIDDHLKYANQCAEIGINVYLLNCPWNKGDFPGIKRVYSWQDLIQLVTTE